MQNAVVNAMLRRILAQLPSLRRGLLDRMKHDISAKIERCVKTRIVSVCQSEDVPSADCAENTRRGLELVQEGWSKNAVEVTRRRQALEAHDAAQGQELCRSPVLNLHASRS